VHDRKQRQLSLFAKDGDGPDMGTSGITRKSYLPFLGRGILGSGWQRQTCPENSPDPVDEALKGVLESIEPSPSTESLLVTSTLKCVGNRFLVARGDVDFGDGSSSSLALATAFEVGAVPLS
jgi:hypothetical protein